jgi:hypothetical protein
MLIGNLLVIKNTPHTTATNKQNFSIDSTGFIFFDGTLVTYLTIILACMMLLPIPCPRYVTDKMLPNIAVDRKKPKF